MVRMKLEFHFDNRRWAGETDCYIIQIDHEGRRRIAKPMALEFAPLEEMDSSTRNEPSLRFHAMDRFDGFFEALVEGLARAGFKAESNDIGELKATKLHLTDMQKLVFNGESKS